MLAERAEWGKFPQELSGIVEKKVCDASFQRSTSVPDRYRSRTAARCWSSSPCWENRAVPFAADQLRREYRSTPALPWNCAQQSHSTEFLRFGKLLLTRSNSCRALELAYLPVSAEGCVSSLDPCRCPSIAPCPRRLRPEVAPVPGASLP